MEDEVEEEQVQTPDELLQLLQDGEMDRDPMMINYEIKRLEAQGIECNEFTKLFTELLSLLKKEELIEITGALYPGFCNWIEILVMNEAIDTFSIMELYNFHEDVLSGINEQSCNNCMGNLSDIWSRFYEIIDEKYQVFDGSIFEKIHLASLREFHDELADILSKYNINYADTDDNAGSVSEYLHLVDTDKIMDPVLETKIKDLIREDEW